MPECLIHKVITGKVSAPFLNSGKGAQVGLGA